VPTGVSHKKLRQTIQASPETAANFAPKAPR
jgi:hypothetical protein